MDTKSTSYIPALHYRWLSPLYDPLLKWGMQEERFKRRLIELAHIQQGMAILDLGCGTGTLTILIKQTHPNANVVGLDGDEQILAIARAKAKRAGVKIVWDQGLAYDLPYESDKWDRVLSSLVVHHLTTENKLRAFQEILRVLRNGGEIHIVDFGKPRSHVMRRVAGVMGRLEQAKDNFDGKIPDILMAAGFREVSESAQFVTIFGPLSFFHAIK